MQCTGERSERACRHIYLSPEVITAVFPFLGAKVQDLAVSVLNTLPWNTHYQGSVAMIAIPSYVILLNLIAACNGHAISDSEEIFRRLVDYTCLSEHLTGSKEFVQKCAASLHDNIASFRRDIIELDSLCAPLIIELVCQ